jgi:hypothetical protein
VKDLNERNVRGFVIDVVAAGWMEENGIFK